MLLRKHPLPPSHRHHVPFHDDGPRAQASLRWLGTAGFTFATPDRTIVLDPFVTRFPAWHLAGKALVPDERAIERWIPHADDVLIGHAHFDHILDAPNLCRRTGARFIGSASACQVARAGGVAEEQILEVRGHETIACGDSTHVRGLPALHGRIYGVVPMPGEIETPPPWPARSQDLRCGQVFNWYIEHQGPSDQPLRILHIDSADFFRSSLEGVQADVVCLCAIGRNYRPNYLEEVVELTRPRWIIPCHWDWFFDPMEGPTRELPGVKLAEFTRAIREVGVEPLVLPVGGTFVPALHGAG